MKIEIDKNAGFCWGVVRTIDFAEKSLRENPDLYSLGDIIHNTQEVNRLAALGIKTITTAELDSLPENSKVLIRAHGEPPSTYAEAQRRRLEIIDATCPVVTKVQERIRKFLENSFQIVIFGKKDHAEVIGLVGVTRGQAIVVHSVEDALSCVDVSKPTVLFSQTTMDRQTFYAIADALRERVKTFEVASIEETAVEFHAKDTICGQVSGREKKLREFAAANDVIIFTAGKKSSNGKVLFAIAKEANPKTYFIETIDEVDFSWFSGAGTVGITGATSTPQWFMEELRQLLEKKFN